MFKILHSIIVILYVTQFVAIDAAVKTQSTTLHFPGKELHFSLESYINGKLTYVLCNKNEENSERKCKLIHEKKPYSDDTYKCDITLKLDHRQGNITFDKHRISAIPFGNNKVILYQAEKGENANVQINTINLDDCKVTENEISITNYQNDPIFAVIITPYEDSYDIVYKNSKTCANKGFCKMTIDSAGKIIEGPANSTHSPIFVTIHPYIVAIDSRYRDKGTFSVENDEDPSSMNFVIHKPDGSTKYLGKHKIQLLVAKSTSNNFLSICYKKDASKYSCIQYDEDGNQKIQIDQIRNSSNEIVYLYNLPSGGFLIFAENCDKLYCDLTSKEMIAIKVNSAGKQVGKFNIGKLKFNPNYQIVRWASSFYIDSSNNYCLSVANYHSTEIDVSNNAYIESHTTCFADEDFSK